MFSNSPTILTKFYGPESASSLTVADKAGVQQQRPTSEKDKQREDVPSVQEDSAPVTSSNGMNSWKERWMHQRKAREEAWNKYFEHEHTGPVTAAQDGGDSVSGVGPERFHPRSRCHPWMAQRCQLWSSCYSHENRPIFREFDFA
ncbi:unnamed protein product [Lymnaea stagnalis]|uniref:Uncharacterized protein n=1 Tax=Lymnaea stagnalis TaxID=6523 RepID=A0AAV2HZC9_LYMST